MDTQVVCTGTENEYRLLSVAAAGHEPSPLSSGGMGEARIDSEGGCTLFVLYTLYVNLNLLVPHLPAQMNNYTLQDLSNKSTLKTPH